LGDSPKKKRNISANVSDMRSFYFSSLIKVIEKRKIKIWTERNDKLIFVFLGVKISLKKRGHYISPQ